MCSSLEVFMSEEIKEVENINETQIKSENKTEKASEGKKLISEEKFKDFLSKSAEVSKNAFSKASSAVQKFSDQSVLKIQRQTAKSNRSKKYAELGELLSNVLLQKGAKIENLSELPSSEDLETAFDSIKDIQKEIVAINKEIKDLDKQIETK